MSQTPDQNPYLIARPIDEAVICRVESQTEVASSAAFQSVDEQHYAGNLTSTEVAVYKARYMKLHDALKKTRENEFFLIQLSKRYMGEIDEQEQELARADQFPDNTITEPSQLRAQILGYYNSAMETDERVEMLGYEAGLLREERKLLNRDYSRLPTAELEALDDDVDIFAEMERRLKLAQTQCQDLWLDIDMLKMEAKRSREQYRQAIDAEQEAQQEVADLKRKVGDITAEWVISCDLPGQYSKEAEKARKYKSNAEKELVNLQQEFAELSDQLAELELKVRTLDIEKANNKTELDALRLENADKKQLLEKTIRNHDTWYEIEMMNRTEKARYLQRIHLAEETKRDLMEEISKLTKERDTYVRHWKKAQVHIDFLTDSVRIVQQLHDKARARYVVTPKYDGEMAARKRRLARSIQHLTQELEDEKKRTINEMTHVGRTVNITERRLVMLEHLRAENWELIRLTTTLTEGLGKAILEFSVAKARCERLLEELSDRTKQMEEQQKILDDLGSRLADVSALYTKMKLERNKCVSMLQTSIKLALDTRERLRLHANEAEIIIYRLQRYDQELIRERTLYGAAIVQRDHRRNEMCKMFNIQSEQLSKREQMRRSIHRINLMFNQTEAETLSVKKAKERCAQIRNERAILLIERNQEIYILQERIAAQEVAGRNAELALLTLDSEYEFIKRYRNQLARYKEVVLNTLPAYRTLNNQVQGLVHQLIGSRMELSRLVEQAEDPDVVGRLRLLGGKDPSQTELWITLGKLERRMAAKEEDMAEKNLTYEAVCRLVDSLQVRATSGKEDTLILATEVNKIKARLQEMKNRMKTMYAELVVCGAERNDLKEQVMNLEQKLDLYNLRMRYGRPPSPTLERKIRSKMRGAKLKTDYGSGDSISIQPMRAPGTMPTRPFGPIESTPRSALCWHQVTIADSQAIIIRNPIEQRRSIRDRRSIRSTLSTRNKVAANDQMKGSVSLQDDKLPPIVTVTRMSQVSQRQSVGHETGRLDPNEANLNNAICIRPALRPRPVFADQSTGSKSTTSMWYSKTSDTIADITMQRIPLNSPSSSITPTNMRTMSPSRAMGTTTSRATSVLEQRLDCEDSPEPGYEPVCVDSAENAMDNITDPIEVESQAEEGEKRWTEE